MVTSTTVTGQYTKTATESRDNPSVVELNCRTEEDNVERSVSWHPDTVDNEDMKKRSSKSCCIFTGKKSHRKNSNTEEESDTESDKSDHDLNPKSNNSK